MDVIFAFWPGVSCRRYHAAGAGRAWFPSKGLAEKRQVRHRRAFMRLPC